MLTGEPATPLTAVPRCRGRASGGGPQFPGGKPKPSDTEQPQNSRDRLPGCPRTQPGLATVRPLPAGAQGWRRLAWPPAWGRGPGRSEGLGRGTSHAGLVTSTPSCPGAIGDTNAVVVYGSPKRWV